MSQYRDTIQKLAFPTKPPRAIGKAKTTVGFGERPATPFARTAAKADRDWDTRLKPKGDALAAEADKIVAARNKQSSIIADLVAGAKGNKSLAHIEYDGDLRGMKTASLVTGATDALSRFGLTGANGRAALEVAGLGALAVPVGYHMAKADNNTDRALSGVEMGGLGLLAAPEIAHLLGR